MDCTRHTVRSLSLEVGVEWSWAHPDDRMMRTHQNTCAGRAQEKGPVPRLRRLGWCVRYNVCSESSSKSARSAGFDPSAELQLAATVRSLTRCTADRMDGRTKCEYLRSQLHWLLRRPERSGDNVAQHVPRARCNQFAQVRDVDGTGLVTWWVFNCHYCSRCTSVRACCVGIFFCNESLNSNKL